MKLQISKLILAILPAVILVMVHLMPVAAADELKISPGGNGKFEQYLNTGIESDMTTTTATTSATPITTTKLTIISTIPETTTTIPPSSTVQYVEIEMPDGSITVVECDADNRVERDINITGASKLLSFILNTGTQIITSDGESPGRIVITEILGRNTSNYAIRIYEANGYDSNGSLTNTYFNPPVLMAFHYFPDELPEKATGVYVAFYDEMTNDWIRLQSPSGYTPQTDELAVLVTHLSIYGIFADFTPLPSAEGMSTATIIWIIIGGLLVIFLLVLFIVIIRRRHKKTDTK